MSLLSGAHSKVFPGAPTGLVFPGDAGVPRGVNFPDRNDWAPRLGFAWDLYGDGKSSLRGGFGAYYDVLKGEDNLQFNGQPPFYSSAGLDFSQFEESSCLTSNCLAQPYAAFGAVDPFPSRAPTSSLDFKAAGFLPFGSSNSVFFVDPHLRTPYSFQYDLSYQHEIAHSTLLELAYVGSSSHKLTALQDRNPFVLGTKDRVLNLLPGNSTCTSNPATLCSFASLPEFVNGAAAHFNSLQASLRKQLSPGKWWGPTYFTLAYTYSHNIDNASGFRNRNSAIPAYDPNIFLAASDFDLRHRLIFSGGWNLPFGDMSPRLPKALTHGWSLFPIISWRSGFPIDIFANLPNAFSFTSVGPSGAGDAGLVRANLVGPLRMLDPRASGHFWFDPASFNSDFPNDDDVVANPALRTYGTLPRNFLRGPGRVNVNLALAKVTRLWTEGKLVEFRADFFNLFNHAEFSDPVTDMASPNFGQIVSTSAPRIIQISARFTF